MQLEALTNGVLQGLEGDLLRLRTLQERQRQRQRQTGGRMVRQTDGTC